MNKLRNRFAVAFVAFSCAACQQSMEVESGSTIQSDSPVMAYAMPASSADDSSDGKVTDHSVSDRSLSRDLLPVFRPVTMDTKYQLMEILPYKTECEGHQIQQCYLMGESGKGEFTLLYEDIAGLEFQWGTKYEVVLSETALDVGAGMSDVSTSRYELAEVRYTERARADETFEYVSRHVSTEIIELEQSRFSLGAEQSFVCEPESCEQLERIINADESVVLDLSYPELAEEPLQLLSILCSASSEEFTSACL